MALYDTNDSENNQCLDEGSIAQTIVKFYTTGYRNASNYFPSPVLSPKRASAQARWLLFNSADHKFGVADS